MKLRIARKIAKAARYAGLLRRYRYSRHQVTRALLRVLRSPLLLTDKDAAWDLNSVGRRGDMTWYLVSPKCMLAEQRGRLHAARKRNGRIWLEQP